MAQGGQYNTEITATSSHGAVKFWAAGTTTIELLATTVLFINSGSSTQIRVDFTTTSGSTGGYPVRAGESVSISSRAPGAFYTGLSYASSAVSSVECRILAVR